MEPTFPRLTTTARFECPLCKHAATAVVEVPEVDWYIEPLSDSLSQEDSEMECDHCGEFFGVCVQNSPAGCHIELHDFPKVEVDAEEAPFSTANRYDNSWLNQDPFSSDDPQVPLQVFDSNRHHLSDVLAEYGTGGTGVLRWSGSVINRMVFAETVSSMEAYLGDTLLKAVQTDPSAMKRLVISDKVLSAERVSLEEILANPQIVKDKVLGYLRELLYHNLAKVEVVFRIALQINIFPDKDLKARLYKTIQLRHDVVHRNGRDKNGIEQQFPAMLVKETMTDVQAMVRHIERSLKAITSKRS